MQPPWHHESRRVGHVADSPDSDADYFDFETRLGDVLSHRVETRATARSTGGHASTSAAPTASMCSQVKQRLVDALSRDEAMSCLQHLLLPMLQLRVALMRRHRPASVDQKETSSSAQTLISVIRRSSSPFCHWSKDVITSLLRSHSRPSYYRGGEIVVFDGETHASSGILLLLSGSVVGSLNEPLATRHRGRKTASTRRAPSLLCEDSVLCERSHSGCIRAATEGCVVVRIPSSHVWEVIFTRLHLPGVDPHLWAEMRSFVASQRIEKWMSTNSRSRVPTLLALLHGNWLLHCAITSPEFDVSSLLEDFEPLVLFPGDPIVHEGELVDAIYVMARGCAIATSHSLDGETVSYVARAGASFGEMALLTGDDVWNFSLRVDDTSVAELWKLNREKLLSHLQAAPVAFQQKMARWWMSNRERWTLRETESPAAIRHFISALRLVPMLCCCSDATLTELWQKRSTQYFPSGAVVAVATANCTALGICIRGSVVSVGGTEVVQEGDFLGECCLAPHLWHHDAVARGETEVAWISAQTLETHLQACRMYHQSLELCHRGIELRAATRITAGSELPNPPTQSAGPATAFRGRRTSPAWAAPTEPAALPAPKLTQNSREELILQNWYSTHTHSAERKQCLSMQAKTASALIEALISEPQLLDPSRLYHCQHASANRSPWWLISSPLWTESASATQFELLMCSMCRSNDDHKLKQSLRRVILWTMRCEHQALASGSPAATPAEVRYLSRELSSTASIGFVAGPDGGDSMLLVSPIRVDVVRQSTPSPVVAGAAVSTSPFLMTHPSSCNASVPDEIAIAAPEAIQSLDVTDPKCVDESRSADAPSSTPPPAGTERYMEQRLSPAWFQSPNGVDSLPPRALARPLSASDAFTFSPRPPADANTTFSRPVTTGSMASAPVSNQHTPYRSLRHAPIVSRLSPEVLLQAAPPARDSTPNSSRPSDPSVRDLEAPMSTMQSRHLRPFSAQKRQPSPLSRMVHLSVASDDGDLNRSETAAAPKTEQQTATKTQAEAAPDDLWGLMEGASWAPGSMLFDGGISTPREVSTDQRAPSISSQPAPAAIEDVAPEGTTRAALAADYKRLLWEAARNRSSPDGEGDDVDDDYIPSMASVGSAVSPSRDAFAPIVLLLHVMGCSHLEGCDSLIEPVVQVVGASTGRVYVTTPVMVDVANPQWTIEQASFITVLMRREELTIQVCDGSEPDLQPLYAATLPTADLAVNRGAGCRQLPLLPPGAAWFLRAGGNQASVKLRLLATSPKRDHEGGDPEPKPKATRRPSRPDKAANGSEQSIYASPRSKRASLGSTASSSYNAASAIDKDKNFAAVVLSVSRVVFAPCYLEGHREGTSFDIMTRVFRDQQLVLKCVGPVPPSASTTLATSRKPLPFAPWRAEEATCHLESDGGFLHVEMELIVSGRLVPSSRCRGTMAVDDLVVNGTSTWLRDVCLYGATSDNPNPAAPAHYATITLQVLSAQLLRDERLRPTTAGQLALVHVRQFGASDAFRSSAPWLPDPFLIIRPSPKIKDTLGVVGLETTTLLRTPLAFGTHEAVWPLVESSFLVETEPMPDHGREVQLRSLLSEIQIEVFDNEESNRTCIDRGVIRLPSSTSHSRSCSSVLDRGGQVVWDMIPVPRATLPTTIGGQRPVSNRRTLPYLLVAVKGIAMESSAQGDHATASSLNSDLDIAFSLSWKQSTDSMSAPLLKCALTDIACTERLSDSEAVLKWGPFSDRVLAFDLETVSHLASLSTAASGASILHNCVLTLMAGTGTRDQLDGSASHQMLSPKRYSDRKERHPLFVLSKSDALLGDLSLERLCREPGQIMVPLTCVSFQECAEGDDLGSSTTHARFFAVLETFFSFAASDHSVAARTNTAPQLQHFLTPLGSELSAPVSEHISAASDAFPVEVHIHVCGCKGLPRQRSGHPFVVVQQAGSVLRSTPPGLLGGVHTPCWSPMDATATVTCLFRNDHSRFDDGNAPPIQCIVMWQDSDGDVRELGRASFNVATVLNSARRDTNGGVARDAECGALLDDVFRMKTLDLRGTAISSNHRNPDQQCDEWLDDNAAVTIALHHKNLEGRKGE